MGNVIVWVFVVGVVLWILTKLLNSINKSGRELPRSQSLRGMQVSAQGGQWQICRDLPEVRYSPELGTGIGARRPSGPTLPFDVFR